MADKILVMVASYKDPELSSTVKLFYDNAQIKDRLLFSVISQADTHPDLSFIPNDQIKYLKVKSEESFGVCWARALIEKEFDDYDYFLHLDSHMYPSMNWDVDIINTFIEAKQKHSSKLVLSAYPASYEIVDGIRVETAGTHHSGNTLKGVRHTDWPKGTNPPHLEQIYYIHHSLLFGEKEFISDVPMDPNQDFWSEEYTRSIRAYAKGYKIVFFKTPMVYHLYGPERVRLGMIDRPWNDRNPNFVKMCNPVRRKEFFSGALQDEYSVSIDIIKQFRDETGLIILGLN